MQLADLDARRHAEDLRQTWQGRVLAAAQGRMIFAVTSMLAHSYPEALPVLIRIVRPSCWNPELDSLRAPFLASAAKISKRGCIVADVVSVDERIVLDVVVFPSLGNLQYELRKLADRLKLSDHDRMEFFAVALAWVVADRRLDPAMDPRDPDARRLVH